MKFPLLPRNASSEWVLGATLTPGQMLARCATHKDAEQDQIPWEVSPAKETAACQQGLGDHVGN